jgi:hypothetical protein
MHLGGNDDRCTPGAQGTADKVTQGFKQGIALLIEVDNMVALERTARLLVNRQFPGVRAQSACTHFDSPARKMAGASALLI